VIRTDADDDGGSRDAAPPLKRGGSRGPIIQAAVTTTLAGRPSSSVN